MDYELKLQLFPAWLRKRSSPEMCNGHKWEKGVFRAVLSSWRQTESEQGAMLEVNLKVAFNWPMSDAQLSLGPQTVHL